MRKNLSKYKFKKIATESFKNGLRLHFDSILLYKNKSFPSSFHLSVLAIEELAKSEWVEHYYWSSDTNNNWPDEDFEQEWLKLLYLHHKKHKVFLRWGGASDYSPKFVEFVEKKQLELKKQRAIYVGLDRDNGKIDVNSRVSVPTRIKDKDARQMISILNDLLIEACETKLLQEFCFDIEEKDKLLDKELLIRLKKWKFRSGIRSKRWYKEWRKRRVTNQDK